MPRHAVPGTDHWFDFRDLSELNEDHQNRYLDLGDQLREKKREAEREALIAAHPGMIPDPDQVIPVTLTREETLPIRDLVLSWIMADSSFGSALPYPLPLAATNVLRLAMAPVYSALNGVVPADPTPEVPTSTSSSTSPESADVSRPEPPAES